MPSLPVAVKANRLTVAACAVVAMTANQPLAAFAADITSSKPIPEQSTTPQAIPVEHLTQAQKDEANEYLTRGEQLQKTGQYEKAEKELKTAIKLRPGLAQAHYALAESYYSRGRRTEAIGEYSIAINLRPKHGMPYFYRGLIYSDLNDHKSAVADFSRAVEYSPTKDRIWKARAFSYAKLKMYDKAIFDYKKSIELQPRVQTTMLSLADCCLDAGKYDEALSTATQFLVLKPHDARGYVTRARVYKKLGKTDLAARDLKKASEEGENFEL